MTAGRKFGEAAKGLSHESDAPQKIYSGDMGWRIDLPQQAQTIELISGHTYIRKRISLTFFIKKLILWSKRLLQGFLGDLTCFIYRAVTFFNEINLPPHNSYYLRNTVKLICRSSSIIN